MAEIGKLNVTIEYGLPVKSPVGSLPIDQAKVVKDALKVLEAYEISEMALKEKRDSKVEQPPLTQSEISSSF